MADERPPPSPWPMLVVLGLACGVALGGLLVLILRERKRDLFMPTLQPLALPPPPPPMPQLAGWMMPSSPMIPAQSADSKLGTLTVGNDSARTVFQAANGREWIVQVACVAPSGAFAFFSTDPNLVGSPTQAPANARAVPSGGQPADLSLKPGEILYVRGSAPSTVVSFSARAI